MIDVDRLNNTINELEEQSRNIKSASEVYRELAEVAGEIAATSNQQEDMITKIEKLNEVFSSLKDKNEETLKSISDLENHIKEEMRNVNAELISGVKMIASENNKLYLEMQQYIDSKNELLKSDIKIELRNLNDRFTKDLSEHTDFLKENFNNMRVILDSINASIAENDKKVEKKFNIVFGLIVVSIIVGVVGIVMK